MRKKSMCVCVLFNVCLSVGEIRIFVYGSL